MARFWTLLVFVIDVLAIVDVWKREPDLQKRILWIAVILLLPFFGALAWYGISRKYIRL